MAHELRLVDGDVLDADGVLVGAHVDHAVDHDEGVAMRQQPQDFTDVDGAKRVAHSSPLFGFAGVARHAAQPSDAAQPVARRLRRPAVVAGAGGNIGDDAGARGKHGAVADGEMVGDAHLPAHHDVIPHLARCRICRFARR